MAEPYRRFPRNRFFESYPTSSPQGRSIYIYIYTIYIYICTLLAAFPKTALPLHPFSYTRSKPPSSTLLLAGFYLFKLASANGARATWLQRGPPRANLPSCIIPTGYFQYLMLLRSSSKLAERRGEGKEKRPGADRQTVWNGAYVSVRRAISTCHRD